MNVPPVSTAINHGESLEVSVLTSVKEEGSLTDGRWGAFWLETGILLECFYPANLNEGVDKDFQQTWIINALGGLQPCLRVFFLLL